MRKKRAPRHRAGRFSKTQSVFSREMQAAASTSSGQSPYRSPWPCGQGSLHSLAPPLPNKPASLGFVWVPGSHTCGLSGVFSDVHAAGKHDLDSLPPSADGGTLRGACGNLSDEKPAALIPARASCPGPAGPGPWGRPCAPDWCGRRRGPRGP